MDQPTNLTYHPISLQIFREFLEHLPLDDDGEHDEVPPQLSPSPPTQQMIQTSPAQAQKRIASTTLVSIEHELRKIMTACCRKVAMFIHILVPERLLSSFRSDTSFPYFVRTIFSTHEHQEQDLEIRGRESLESWKAGKLESLERLISLLSNLHK